ncbi:MAG: hypothetical protein ACFB5Z_14450 [Elainellaceae cyanobacterium]
MDKPAESEIAALNEQIRFTRVWARSPAGALRIVAGHGSVVADA